MRLHHKTLANGFLAGLHAQNLSHNSPLVSDLSWLKAAGLVWGA
jgi:hypothetical protein